LVRRSPVAGSIFMYYAPSAARSGSTQPDSPWAGSLTGMLTVRQHRSTLLHALCEPATQLHHSFAAGQHRPAADVTQRVTYLNTVTEAGVRKRWKQRPRWKPGWDGYW
jgi:hypothetical protein